MGTQIAKKGHRSRKKAEWVRGRFGRQIGLRHMLENRRTTWDFGCGYSGHESSTTAILAVLTALVGPPILAVLTQRKHPNFPAMIS
jgi:hypothetical protein